MRSLRGIAILVALCSCFTFAAHAQGAKEQAEKYLAVFDYERAAPLLVKAVQENRKDVDLALKTGEVFAELEKHDSALLFYTIAEDLDDSPKVLRPYALALAKAGNIEDAIEVCDDLIYEYPNDVHNRLALAEVYIVQGEWQKADLTLREARKLDDKLPDTYVTLGDLYFSQNVFALAIQNYEEALKRDPNLVEPSIKLARSYHKMAVKPGQDKETRNQYFKDELLQWGKVGKLAPDNSRAFEEQGRILYLAKRYYNAIPAFRRVIELRPEDNEIRWLLAESVYKAASGLRSDKELRKALFDTAAMEMDWVIANLPDKAEEAKELKARSLYSAYKFSEAAAAFAKMHQAGTIDNNDLERYSRASLYAGDTTNAIVLMQETIDAQPKKCKLTRALGELYRKVGDNSKAIETYERALACDLDPEDKSVVLYYMGRCATSLEQPDTALMYLHKAAATDSANALVYLDMMNVLSTLERYDEVVSTFELGLPWLLKKERLAVVIPTFYQLGANGHYLSEDWSALKSFCNAWITEFPEDSQAHLFLGISQQSLGDMTSACTSYRKAVKLDPKNDSAKEALQNCGG